MAADIPTTEPATLQAGTTLRFTRSITDYAANDGWTLSYALRGSGPQITPIDFTASASGADFSVTVAKADTAAWMPGIYTLVGYVESATERYEVVRQTIEITADVFAATAFDSRTYYERLLDQVRAMISDGAVRSVIEYEWNGVRTKIVSLMDALKAEGQLAGIVANEKASASGKQQKILTRFVSPR